MQTAASDQAWSRRTRTARASTIWQGSDASINPPHKRYPAGFVCCSIYRPAAWKTLRRALRKVEFSLIIRACDRDDPMKRVCSAAVSSVARQGDASTGRQTRASHALGDSCILAIGLREPAALLGHMLDVIETLKIEQLITRDDCQRSSYILEQRRAMTMQALARRACTSGWSSASTIVPTRMSTWGNRRS